MGESTRKQKYAIIEVSPNKQANGANGLKRGDDDGDALIGYRGSISKAINNHVESETSEHAEFSRIRATKSELKEVHSSISELVKLVEMALKAHHRH